MIQPGFYLSLYQHTCKVVLNTFYGGEAHRAKVPRVLYWFPRASGAKDHRLGDLNSRNVLSHSSGGQKFKIKVLAGLVPPKGCSRPLCQVLLLLFYKDTSHIGLEAHHMPI